MRRLPALRTTVLVLSAVVLLGIGGIPAQAAKDKRLQRQVVTPTLFHFNGNPPEDVGCSGVGNVDVAMNTCSDLRETTVLSTATAARWNPAAALNQPALDRSQIDPNWIWVLASPTTIEGTMTVSFWASVNATALVFGMAWRFQIWADGALAFTTPVDGIDTTYTQAHIPEKQTVQIELPQITASSKIVIKVDPEFADTGQGAVIYYDSATACPLAATGPCDSTVTFPVVGPTAVQFEHFRARASRGNVVLNWRTASESDVLGFNVWRRDAGGELKVNRSIMSARGALHGADYRYVDRTVRPGRAYTYRLEIVQRDGSKISHGSTRVRVAR